MEKLVQKSTEFLKQLIQTPSFSKEEAETATLITDFFNAEGIACERIYNNIICKNKFFDATKPTLLLNSHHDTVKPNPNYTRNPFEPLETDGKLYGLGSNDAGGCLVGLMATFLHYYTHEHLKYNLLFVASAEEEISGRNGIEAVIPVLPDVEAAIVGEPTLLQMAVAERGLMVLDCTAQGKPGHAARKEGENAISKAIEDIIWFHSYKFEKASPLLGENRMTATVIETENKAHNVVPGTCNFVVDVRVNELYTFEEVLNEIKQHIRSEIKPRSTRLRSTFISNDHVLVKAGMEMGKTYYGSPTTSDKALMPFPALKIGPGDSARSHSADEYIYLQEIEKGIRDYIELVNKVCK